MTWDWGIALGVAGLGAFDLIPAGVGSSVPYNPRLAKGCFLLSAALLTISTLGVLWFYPEGNPVVRIVLSAVVGALIFGGTAAALNWVDRQMPKSEENPPLGGIGGKGGDAKVGGSGIAVGGEGGRAGKYGRGGDGGSAEVHGDGMGAGGAGHFTENWAENLVGGIGSAWMMIFRKS